MPQRERRRVLRPALPRDSTGNRGFEQGPGIPGSFREIGGGFGDVLGILETSRRDERVRGGRVSI